MSVPPESTLSQRIIRVDGREASRRDDVLVVEEPLEIRVAQTQADGQRLVKRIAVTMRTPGDDFALAAGFLHGEGLLQRAEQLLDIRYCLETRESQRYNVVTVELLPEAPFEFANTERHFYTTSSCGVCGKASIDAVDIFIAPKLTDGVPSVDPMKIHQLNAGLRDAQRLFDDTGGLHAATLFDPSGACLAIAEDIGRHNAVDKLIGGRLLEEKFPLDQHIMFVSSRASFEIMQKALAASIPIVAAVGAPSTLAVDVARRFGVTLLGFVRDGRFNVYHDTGRLVGVPGVDGV